MYYLFTILSYSYFYLSFWKMFMEIEIKNFKQNFVERGEILGLRIKS